MSVERPLPPGGRPRPRPLPPGGGASGPRPLPRHAPEPVVAPFVVAPQPEPAPVTAPPATAASAPPAATTAKPPRRPSRARRALGRSLQAAFITLMAVGTLIVGITVVPQLLSTTDATKYTKVDGDYVVVSADFPLNHLSVPNRTGLAPIDRETVDPQGYLGIPQDVHRVGVFTGAGRLDGTVGDVVIAGHVNYVGQGAGYLGDLSKLKVGQVVITRGSGLPKAWRITKVSMYLKAFGLPQSIFRAKGSRELTLVTCGGVLDVQEGSYLSNVVVTAKPVRTIVRDRIDSKQ